MDAERDEFKKKLERIKNKEEENTMTNARGLSLKLQADPNADIIEEVDVDDLSSGDNDSVEGDDPEQGKEDEDQNLEIKNETNEDNLVDEGLFDATKIKSIDSSNSRQLRSQSIDVSSRISPNQDPTNLLTNVLQGFRSVRKMTPVPVERQNTMVGKKDRPERPSAQNNTTLSRKLSVFKPAEAHVIPAAALKNSNINIRTDLVMSNLVGEKKAYSDDELVDGRCEGNLRNIRGQSSD